jgi:hypothetical protein
MALQPQYADETRLDESAFDKMRLMSQVAWYHPNEDAVYVSNDDRTPRFIDGNCVVPSVTKALDQKIQFRKGKLNADSIYSIYNKHDGWEDLALQYTDWKKRHAGIMAPSNFSGIEVTNVLTNVLFGVNERQFVLQDAPRKLNTPYLTMALDTWSGFEVQTDIPIGAEISTSQGAYSRQTVTLKMDGAHIARYDELDMKPFYHDIWRDNLENIGRRMVKAKAQKVATELETATGVATADWAAYTTDHHTTNPLDAIGTISDTIIGNDGVVSKAAMHGKTYRDYISNQNINGIPSPAPDAVNQTFGTSAFTTTLPKAGLTAYVDNLMTATVMVIWDDEAVILAQGPVGTAQYRDEHHRSQGYYAKDYNTVKIVQSGKIRKLTSTTA